MQRLFLALLLGIFLVPNLVRAYDTETHEYLTAEIIAAYNRNFPGKTVPQFWSIYLSDGSRREDDQFRALNHFYDPVHDRGFHSAELGEWNKSPDWAVGENLQNQGKYKIAAGVASILSAAEERNLGLLSSETDFAWERGIRAYARGDEAKAAFVLGHILHLIEDLGVPEHTRNDAHPGDSPYEKWTAQFTRTNPDRELNLTLSPKSFPDLNSYFLELAKYSNSNFYSKGTIGIQSGYNLPQPQSFENQGVFRLAINDDIVLFKQPITSNILIGTNRDIIFNSTDVMRSYWSHLAPKVVQYGAGVVNLFVQEGEKAKNDPNFVREDPRSLLGQVLDAGRNVITAAVDGIRGFLAGSAPSDSGQIAINQPAAEVKPADSSVAETVPGRDAAASAPSTPSLEPVRSPENMSPSKVQTLEIKPPEPENVLVSAPSALPQTFVAGGGKPPEPVIALTAPVSENPPPEATSTDVYSGTEEATSTEPVATSTPPEATSTPLQILLFTATTTASTTLHFEWSLTAESTSTLFELNPPAEYEIYSGTSTQFDYSIPAVRSFEETKNFRLKVQSGAGEETSTTATVILPATGSAPPPPPPPPGPSGPTGVIENLAWNVSTSTHEITITGRVWSNNPANRSRMEVEFLLLADGFVGGANRAGDFAPTGSTSTIVFSVPEGRYHFQTRVGDETTSIVTPWTGEQIVDVSYPPAPASLAGAFTAADFPNGYCGFGKTSIASAVDTILSSAEFYAACVNGDCQPPNTFRIYAADGATLLAESDGASTTFGYPDAALIFQNFTGANRITLTAGETYFAAPYSARGQCMVDPYNSAHNQFYLR